MKFTETKTVDIHDVDFNGVARLSTLMKYIQSAAQSQLTSNGMSYDELQKEHKAFIISRITMEFTESVYAYDEIKATSYPCKSRGYSFLRCYTLEKDGRMIGRAISVWALVDTESRDLIKVNNFDLRITPSDPLDMSLVRFALPADMHEVGTYTVNYADIDQNCHMNNTKYPDMYSNFLPLEGKRIGSITISYVNEARKGERLHVESTMDQNGYYYFKTIRSDGKINTEAQIQLVNI